jgi:hypothetical protein
MTEIQPHIVPAVEKIVSLVHGILSFLPKRQLADPFAGVSPDSLLGKSVHADLIMPEETVKGIGIGMDLDFCTLKARYNARHNRVSKESLLQLLSEGEFKHMIVVQDAASMLFTMQGILRRGLEAPNNVKYHWRLNGTEFSAYDNIFQAMTRTVSDPKQVNENDSIGFIDGDIPRAAFQVRLTVEEPILHTLRIMEIAHRLAPTLEVLRPEFSGMTFQRLDLPTSTIGFHSFASQIMYHFPFLFDFERRLFFFKMSGFDLTYSLQTLSQVFAQGPWNRRLNALRVKTILRTE